MMNTGNGLIAQLFSAPSGAALAEGGAKASNQAENTSGVSFFDALFGQKNQGGEASAVRGLMDSAMAFLSKGASGAPAQAAFDAFSAEIAPIAAAAPIPAALLGGFPGAVVSVPSASPSASPFAMPAAANNSLVASPAVSPFRAAAEFIAQKFSESDPKAAPVVLPEGETISPETVLAALAQQYVTGDAGNALKQGAIEEGGAPAPVSADPALTALRGVWSSFVQHLPTSPVGAVSLPDTANIAAALHTDAGTLAPLSKALDGAIDAALKAIAKDPAATARLSPDLQEQIAAHISAKAEINVSIESDGLPASSAPDAPLAEQLGDVLQKFRLLYDVMASGALEQTGAVIATLQYSAEYSMSFTQTTATDISFRAVSDSGMKNLAAALDESDAARRPAAHKKDAAAPHYADKGNAQAGAPAFAPAAANAGQSFMLGGEPQAADASANADMAPIQAKIADPKFLEDKPAEEKPAAPAFSHWSAFSLRPNASLPGGDISAAQETSYTDAGAAARRTESVLAQVKIALQGHSGGNITGNIRLQLQPAELGQVNIRMQKTAEGRHHIYIAAERPETVTLLQQQETALRGMLQEIIASDSSTDFSFHFFHEDGSPQGERKKFADSMNDGDTASEAPEGGGEQGYSIDGLVNIQA